MSADKPLSPPPVPPKPRSTIERSLVWGGILILLALVAMEYTSKNAQSAAVESVQAKIREIESTPIELKAADFKSAHVKAVVGNKDPRVEDVSSRLLAIGAKRMEIYQWFSVNPLKPRAMYVYYGVGDDPDVLSVSTEEETESILDQHPGLTEGQKAEMLRRAAEGAKRPLLTTDTADDPADDGAPADKK